MIVRTDAESMRPWLEDASLMPGGRAERVCVPESEEEAAALLAECTARREAVTLSGAGTGLTGARIPLGGTVLATDRLGGLRDLRRLPDGTGVAVTGPAASLADLERAAAAEGLFYGPDPTETGAWIGGTIATNASGGRTFRYGPTRRHVRRLRVVLAGGEVIDMPRGRCKASPGGGLTLPLPGGREIRGRLPYYSMPRVKNACGYHCEVGMDLLDLFIGSEGTLGLVTEVELALLPAPESVLAGVVFFPSEGEAWSFLAEARRISYASRGFEGPAEADPARPGAAAPAGESGVVDARLLESFDGASLDFMREHDASIPERARAAIWFEQETRERTEEAIQSRWLALAESHHALAEDSWFAEGPEGRKRFREFRHALPLGVNEWLSRHGQRKIAGDMAVPDESFGRMLAAYREGLDPTGLKWLAFGHLGNNHLHVNILPRDDGEAARAREAYARLVQRITSMGGTVSAEHGLGKIKAKYLATMYGEGVFMEMASLKRTFDPAMILGRGNMIPVEYL